MKLGRSTEHLSLTFTPFELGEICREANIRDTSKLACWARYVPSEDEVHVYLGEGRKFIANSTGTSWRVALDVEASWAQSLEVFGLTPTIYRMVPGRKVIVEVPAIKAPLKRMKPVMEKQGAFIPRTREHFGLRPVRLPAKIEKTVPFVTDAELIKSKDIFNRAIERGYTPQFDGRGRILFFERRAGG